MTSPFANLLMCKWDTVPIDALSRFKGLAGKKISACNFFCVFLSICMFSDYGFGMDPISSEKSIPKTLEPGWELQLIKGEPELVTPVGCRFDSAGRLFVVECHTHFPPENYPGPKVDRIYAFQDTDNDGTLDKQTLFFEGTKTTMGLATHQNGWLYVVTRSSVLRLRDTNLDGVADQHEVLIQQETKADYPHNGLSSISFGPDGLLYFGQGENFGLPYKLIATDHSVQSGGGEGGNLFRCSAEGKKLERVATGFWNPFGTCFDSAGRLWTVENDPDARTPCRLLNVVESGDYGFQFQFGRAGTHPLLAWNGELPGTLPMAAGTGEAPCAVIPFEDSLLVTSWGDNRIERFQLSQQGASWTGKFSTLVQGDTQFRPVDMATAPDGSIYFTDWVDRSYPVHLKGRLWRLIPPKSTDRAELPSLSHEEELGRKLASDGNMTYAARLSHCENNDPFIVQCAILGMTRFHRNEMLLPPTHPRSYGAWLQAWRWLEMCNPTGSTSDARRVRLSAALEHRDDSVRRIAIRYTAESKQKEMIPNLRKLLGNKNLSSQEFSETIAAISFLETGNASPRARDPEREKMLLEVFRTSKNEGLVALAMRNLPTEIESIKDEELVTRLSTSSGASIAEESIAFLRGRRTQSSQNALLTGAKSSELNDELRADCIASLASEKDRLKEELSKLLADATSPEVVKAEIRRVLNGAAAKQLEVTPETEEQFWQQVSTGGNPSAGKRVFLRNACVNCHALNGRGPATGPDLGTLQNSTSRKRIFASIVDPSREIGPLYSTWRIRTEDGKVYVGAKLNGGSNRVRYLAADGSVFELDESEIEEQLPSPHSIMPNDAYRSLSIDELRDLLSFLE